MTCATGGGAQAVIEMLAGYAPGPLTAPPAGGTVAATALGLWARNAICRSSLRHRWWVAFGTFRRLRCSLHLRTFPTTRPTAN